MSAAMAASAKATLRSDVAEGEADAVMGEAGDFGFDRARIRMVELDAGAEHRAGIGLEERAGRGDLTQGGGGGIVRDQYAHPPAPPT